MIRQEVLKICECCGKIYDESGQELLGVNLSDLPADIAITKLIAEKGVTYRKPKRQRFDKRKKKRYNIR
jgi:hypothetical protein